MSCGIENLEMDPNIRGFAHLKFLKEAAERPFSDLEREVEARHSELTKTDSENDLHFVVSDMKEETFVIDQKLNSEVTIHRIFASSPDGGAYCSIGWVVAQDVSNCMNCLALLQADATKHHCFACGNVVCSSCYCHEAFVVEIMQLGKVNVCSDCYQYGGNVKKTNNRRGSKQSLSQNRGVSLLLNTVGTPPKDQLTTDSAVASPYSDVRRIDDESELFPIVENTPVKPSTQHQTDSTSTNKSTSDPKIDEENEGDNEDKENDEVPLSSGLACFFCFPFR